jgi:hypothetical protein
MVKYRFILHVFRCQGPGENKGAHLRPTLALVFSGRTPDGWRITPKRADKAQGQPIGTGSSRKRTREQGKLELRIPPTKSQKRSNGSGLRSES